MATKKKASKNTRSYTVRKKAKSQHPLKKASRLFLPYPIFIFVMLCVGVMLTYSTFSAGAIDYTVKGKVPAPPLTEPAIITSPTGGSVFTAVPITVSGTCPLDSYVNVYRNDFFSGSALCSADGKFGLSIDLFEGANELRARVFNITDDEGPTSPSITVTYNPPGPSKEPTSRPALFPFVIKTDFKIRGYYVGQKIIWEIEVSGGVDPYAINVDWGDGTNSLISQKQRGKFNIEHIYKEAGGEKGSYQVKISATDSDGNKTYMELFVIVNAKDALTPIIGSTGSGNGFFTYIREELLKFLWPVYAIIVLMAISFWLGEREELIVLRRQAANRRRRA